MSPYLLVGLGIVLGVLLGGAIVAYLAMTFAAKVLSHFWSRF